jgi:hypothetical protein
MIVAFVGFRRLSEVRLFVFVKEEILKSYNKFICENVFFFKSYPFTHALSFFGFFANNAKVMTAKAFFLLELLNER